MENVINSNHKYADVHNNFNNIINSINQAHDSSHSNTNEADIDKYDTPKNIIESVNSHSENLNNNPNKINKSNGCNVYLQPEYKPNDVAINTNDINIKLENVKKTHENVTKKLECIDFINKLMFLFLNPKSGSQEGKYFLKIANLNNQSKLDGEYKLIEFNDKGDNFYVYVFDITSKEEYSKGSNLLKDYIDHIDNEYIKVLVAGGDGTVLSVIENLHFLKININKCIFGHIPLGTGNDLSNSLGMGNSIDISNDINSMKTILQRYYHAKSTKVDVWDFRLFMNKENGSIIEISNENKKIKTDSEDKKISCYRRSFINYFSLGYDARVGFGFEKNRCRNRCCNKCVYFWEGCKKNCCRKTIPLNSFLDSFHVINEEKETDLPNQKDNQIIPANSPSPSPSSNDNFLINDVDAYFDKIMLDKSKLFFKSKSTSSNSSVNIKEIVLKGDPVSLVCQNINFYMGGTKDIWSKSGSNIGIKVSGGNNFIENKLENKHLETLLLNSLQKFNDQKLEFFTYESGLKIGFEKILTGQADKVYHGPGPIIVKFKDTPEMNKSDKYNRVYLNIDGEYFHIVRPEELRVRLNTNLCNGSINFLVSPDFIS